MLAADQHGPEKESSARNSSGERRGKNSRTRLVGAQANTRSFDFAARTASGSTDFAQDDSSRSLRVFKGVLLLQLVKCGLHLALELFCLRQQRRIRRCPFAFDCHQT